VQEQRKMEQLEATVSGQQKQLEVLVAGLEKATNQLKASKGGPTIVANQR
jgi:hypothetical protein